jgi:phenylacetate-CoA ligase
MRRKYISRTEILNMLQMTEESIMSFIKKMQKRPPSLLWGHAHGLYQLAVFLEKRGINNIKPKGMYSAGMILYDWQREKIERVLNCVLQDRYGTEELGLIATECKFKEGLHINTDSHYVEFLDKDGQPVKPGTEGFIVVTDLTNKAMPFIRYKLEDIGIASTKKCSCGRTQPMIERISGRVADFLVTPQKELVSGISLTDHFAGHIPGIGQIQIIQEKINYLNLKIVKNNIYNDESTKKIKLLIQDFFGNDMGYHIEFVKNIPQESSGKYRFTICKIEHEIF